jgi:anti-sigma B factor antagonist
MPFVPCQLTIATQSAVTTVRIQGRIYPPDLPRLREQIRQEMSDHRSRAVVLDLAGVNFIDSSVIGFLISTFKLLRGSSRDLALVGLQAPCLETLRVSNLTGILPIYTSHEEALRTLGV